MESIWSTIREETIKPWKERWISRHPTGIGEATWNAIFSGGKEIRPSLLCELWAHLSPSTPIIGELAFALECIHCASLILDDTPAMDNADRRRDRPTIHKAFNTYRALWLALEIGEIVFDIWTKHAPKEPEAAAIWWNFLRDKLLQLAIGQYYDLTGTGDLHTLAILKTGSLFEFATELVALRLGLSRNAWRTWGRQIGVLFQWADDWHDRDEDAAAGNRNAFAEAPVVVCQHYQLLLARSNIGEDWRKRPFGDWLMRYFEEKGPIASSSANASPIAIPDVFVSDKPHEEFMKSLNISNIVSILFKRFTLYVAPSNLFQSLFQHYQPELPEFLNTIMHTSPAMLFKIVQQFKSYITTQAVELWNKLNEKSAEEEIRQEVLKLLRERSGTGAAIHDRPRLLQVYALLLS